MADETVTEIMDQQKDITSAEVLDDLPGDFKPGAMSDSLAEQSQMYEPESDADEQSAASESDTGDSSTGDDTSAGKTEGQPDETNPGWLDNDLLERAKGLGFDESEIRDFGNAKALAVACGRIERTVMEHLGAKTNAEGKVAEKPTTEAAVEPPPTGDVNWSKFNVDLGDEFDERLIGQLAAMNDHYHNQVSRIAHATSAMLQHLQAQQKVQKDEQDAKFFSDVDSLIAADEDYSDVLGKGPSVGMDPGSPEGKTRLEIYDKMLEIHTARTVMKRERLPVDALYRQARNAVLGDRIYDVAKRKVINKARETSGRTIAASTHRKTSTAKDSTSQAIDAVQQFMDDHGIRV